MRRRMERVLPGGVDRSPLLTHTFMLSEIEKAYDLFSQQRDGVLKAAIRPE